MKIELRAVSKSYRSIHALRRVSLEIAPGQIISLLGPNGAGKTTLLRCLAGIAAPDTGDIYFDDQAFRRDRLDLRQRFFVLPDFPFLFWDQTVLRNLAIILHLYHADGNHAEERVLELLREFDLLPLALRPVQTLSRGQAYKAGLVWPCWRWIVRCGCSTSPSPPVWTRTALIRSNATPAPPPRGDARFSTRRNYWTWPSASAIASASSMKEKFTRSTPCTASGSRPGTKPMCWRKCFAGCALPPNETARAHFRASVATADQTDHPPLAGIAAASEASSTLP